MNAVAHFVALVAPEAARRLAALEVHRFAAIAPAAPRHVDLGGARAHVIERWGGDLCGLLNVLTRGELAVLAAQLGMPVTGRAPELRAALWQRGAALERRGEPVPEALQPHPVLLGGHLVVQAPPRGLYPPSDRWPRALPAARGVEPPCDEPDSLDELLAAADRAIGVRLGRRGRDKGAWGNRAAALLGVVERGDTEPDWRGDVEIKTVPVARERSGLWRVVEDPAIAMLDEGGPEWRGPESLRPSSAEWRGPESLRPSSAEWRRPDSLRPSRSIAKLQRTLWLARSDADDADATIVSWYLLEWDATVARLARRYLHVRPKGPAGTDQRGLYLHKRFFADAGFLATLNRAPPGAP